MSTIDKHTGRKLLMELVRLQDALKEARDHACTVKVMIDAMDRSPENLALLKECERIFYALYADTATFKGGDMKYFDVSSLILDVAKRIEEKPCS